MYKFLEKPYWRHFSAILLIMWILISVIYQEHYIIVKENVLFVKFLIVEIFQ